MQPVHRLLDQIRWDPRFRKGRFALGYFDRVARRIQIVPFESIEFPREAPGTFEVWDEVGAVRRVPFHRVRRIYRDGQIIWERRPLLTSVV